MKKIAQFVMLLAVGCFALGCSSAADTGGAAPAGGTAVDTSTDDGGEVVDDLDAEDDTGEDTP